MMTGQCPTCRKVDVLEWGFVPRNVVRITGRHLTTPKHQRRLIDVSNW